MTLPEGTILEGRYRIDKLLAQGGMGTIYQGFDTNLNTSVAIKESFCQTPQTIIQFKQEALILARLRHPALPRVTHHLDFEGRHYLVMDFIEGENLWEIVKAKGQPLEESQAIEYIIQVCRAVSYLHQQNPPIIHRDIKPQNIKITPDGHAVLVDFGIAKLGASGTRTQSGAQGITPGFSPPEQYSGLGTTSASDIYSLGATLYALLTGKKPPDSIGQMVSGAKFTPPDQINPKLSPQISQTITFAMQIRPADRPKSAAAWQRELEALISDPPPVLDQQDKEATAPVVAPPVSRRNKEKTLAGGLSIRVIKATYWLVDEAGLGYTIGPQPLLIGRHSEADIALENLSVSRCHARIRAADNYCFVLDEESANGTFLNNKRLPSGWHPIHPGDRLTVGAVHFQLTATPPTKIASKSKPVAIASQGLSTIQNVPPPSLTVATATPNLPAKPKRLSWIIAVAVAILLGLGLVIYFLFGSAESPLASIFSTQAFVSAMTLS